MISILESILLGLVQGITEWLPVSSKGNVAILAQFLGLQAKEAFSYAIILHLGTLIAAAWYFRKEIAEMLKGEEKDKLKFIAITLIFTGVTALPSYLLLKAIVETASISIAGITVYSQTIFMAVVGFFLLVTGMLQMTKKKQKEAVLSVRNAAMLGLGQGLTVLPGMSRSGTTTTVMLFEGFSPEKAFHLSFLISVPAVLLGELSFNLLEKPALDINMLFGIAAAAIAGFLTIGFLLKVAKKINFGKFCIALGLLYLLISAVSVAMPAVA